MKTMTRVLGCGAQVVSQPTSYQLTLRHRHSHPPPILMDDLVREEASLGRWPRRLLHVPSLTSFEWQPGNRYGDAVEPEYNAITYTWGRWRLKDEPCEKPEVTAIPITGTAWNIPRVDPMHFTAQQLEQVLTKVSQLKPSDKLLGGGIKPVDFVWLDVACIDQRALEPRSAAEIGRQATIFKGAQAVCVWLASHSIESLQRGIESISVSPRSTPPGSDEDAAAIQQITHLLSDPWFSSLWTLQEAFLRYDAMFLDQHGELLEYPPSTNLSGNPSLQDLFEYGVQWCDGCTQEETDSPTSKMYLAAKELIEKRGLKALASFDPMATYAAASQRTTTFPEDRIYGIQQIFGFRFGKSALGVDVGRVFTLTELEDQLGEALMKTFPAKSQFHVFTQHVPQDQRWRMHACSVIPNANRKVHSIWESFEHDEPCCSFSVQNSEKGSKAVHWQGKTAYLSDLLTACEHVAREDVFGELAGNQDAFSVMLDVADELLEFQQYQQSDYRLIPKGLQQKVIREWLVGHFDKNSLQVLLLGPLTGRRYAYMRGLIMLDCGHGEWTRLGVCQWEVTDLCVNNIKSQQFQFLTGEGSGWSKSEGIFGYIN